MVDPHVSAIRPVTPSADGCEDCLRIGSPWLHLRLCLRDMGCWSARVLEYWVQKHYSITPSFHYSRWI
jgi:hypothetical protein